MGRILVVGAQGPVGSTLLPALLAAGEQVLAGTSGVGASADTSGGQAVRVDLRDPATFAPALTAVDRAYLLAPTGEVSHVDLLAPFIDAAVGRGVKVVLQSAIGVEGAAAHTPLRRVEQHLQASGGRFVILRPNWFMDNFHTLWRASIQERSVLALPAGDAACSFIDAKDVGAAAARALLVDDFEGRAWTLTGPEALTYQQAAAVLGAARGRPVRYQNAARADFVAELQHAGVVGANAEHLAELFAAVAAGRAAAVTDDLRQLTGSRGGTLEAYARARASLWT